MGVDGSLVDAAPDVLFELNDGCVCCSVRSDLLDIFVGLQSRLEEFDHVIIETTGLADPAPVMRLFERAEVGQFFTLNGVVAVVDAAHIEDNLDEVEACAEQITYADLLILNKTDGLPVQPLDAIEHRLATLNPLAKRVRAQHAQVDVEVVLNMDRHRHEVPSHHHHDHHHHDHHHHDHHHHDHHHHDHHEHDPSIVTVAVGAEGEVDIDRLDQWLGQLTRRHDIKLLRMKGVLAVPGQEQRFVFQGVRDVVDVRPDRPWADAPRTSRIVFIGRGLHSINLQTEFLSCIQSNSTVH